MLITKRFLQSKSACPKGIVWVEKNCKNQKAITVLKALEKYRWDWANWLIVRVMTRPQYLAYAIFAAEQVIKIYEKECPEDNKPRQAIQAAKAVLKNDVKKNRRQAKKAATAIANIAYVTNVIIAIHATADAAANVANGTYVSYGAYAASHAAQATAVTNELRKKILHYGLTLLKGD